MEDKYIKDIKEYVEAIPFGEVQLTIRRARRKTVEVESLGEETLRYVDNDEAIRDITNMLKQLIENKYNGGTHFKVIYKDGDIRLLSIFNQEKAKYE